MAHAGGGPDNQEQQAKQAAQRPPQGALVGARLRLPGTPHALPRIRQMVVEAAERCRFGGEDIAKIEMAVGEACSNIVEHAYRTLPPPPPDLEVTVQEYDNRIEILILDYSSINFPVDQKPGLPLDDYIETQQRRGLGLYIIKNFVDFVEHRFICGQGNELRLVKYFA
jgi:serine/threonine-protein kinase RsbW